MGFIKSLVEGPPDAVQAQTQSENGNVTALSQQLNEAVRNGDGDLAKSLREQIQLAQDPTSTAGRIQASNAQSDQIGQMLQQQANGQGGPLDTVTSAAQANNIASASSLAASQRGINPGMAAAIAAQTAAKGGQDLVAQRAANQLGAQGQLAAFNANQQGQLRGTLTNQNNNAVAQAASQNQANSAAYSANMGVLGAIGGAAATVATAAHGAVVPGKAKVKGDSPENDTKPYMLSPGEIVIPRSHAKDPEKAKAFVDELLKTKKKAEPKGYSAVLASHKKLEERVKELEKKKGK